MASKFVVPLELPNLYGTPSSIADEGFVVCYIKNGWWTKNSPDGTESDLVLDRPLTGLSQLESTDEITQYDTVKSALEKLQQSILTLEITGGVQGTGYYTGGRFLLQTTLPNVANFTCEDVAACSVVTELQQDVININDTLSGLSDVALSGSYEDLIDTPTQFPPQAHTHEITDINLLQDALDGKFDNPTGDDTQYIKGDGTLGTLPNGSQNLQDVVNVGNETTTNIKLMNYASIELDNGSLLRKGSYNFDNQDVIVSGITNAGDGFIANITGWGNPSGTQWSDLNGTYIKTSSAITPSAVGQGDIGMHTPLPGTFNYYLATPDPGFNGVAYFLAPGNRSGWSDPNDDAFTDSPTNYWRLCSLADYPYTYFVNFSSDPYNFPLTGWVPVDDTIPYSEGGYGFDYINGYDSGFTVSGGGYVYNGNGGISRICSVGYEDMWQAGIRYTFDLGGNIREATNCFNYIPDSTFDLNRRFIVGSRWVLDNGDTYVCTDNTINNATWELQSVVSAALDVVNDTNVTITLDGNYNNALLQAVTMTVGWEGTLIDDRIQSANNWNSKLSSSDLKTINGSSIVGTGDLTVSGLPTGGTTGQILTKNSSTNGDASWIDNYADWTSVVKHTVKNDGTAVIAKGKAVYASGADGTNILVRAASNASEATSSKTMGLLQSQLDTNGNTQTGFVITEGLLGGLNTQGQTAGDPVWLGANGDLIYGLANKPSAPNHLVFVGIVTKVSAGSGEIFVKVQNGFELNELHDVSLSTYINNGVLYRDTVNNLWKHATIATLLGYTPYDASNPNAYITSSALSSYLTTATAASTYQPIGSYQSALNGTGFVKISGTTISYDNTTYQPIITAGTNSQYYRGDKTFQTLDKTAVGLANVDNTSDANKPVSTATQTALNAKQDTLVSGTHIKTINNNSLLGSGNLQIVVPAGMTWMGAFPG